MRLQKMLDKWTDSARSLLNISSYYNQYNLLECTCYVQCLLVSYIL
jgi:hypothetical protein